MERIPYENLTNAEREKLNELISEDIDFFGFMFFNLEDTPEWITLIFMPVTIVVWIVSIYLIMDYMIAWWKAISPFAG